MAEGQWMTRCLLVFGRIMWSSRHTPTEKVIGDIQFGEMLASSTLDVPVVAPNLFSISSELYIFQLQLSQFFILFFLLYNRLLLVSHNETWRTSFLVLIVQNNKCRSWYTFWSRVEDVPRVEGLSLLSRNSLL